VTAPLLVILIMCCTVMIHGTALRALPAGWVYRSVPAVLTGNLIVAFFLTWFAGVGVSLETGFQIVIVCFSLGLCYAFTLVGILYDSPTLALVNAIESYGQKGMPIEALEGVARARPFVSSRLKALIEAGEIAERDGILFLCGKASRLLIIGDIYRKIRGATGAHTG